MTSRRAGAARICGEQDCNERTNRPNHPLCYQHYVAFQADVIDECPNHPGVYKPSQYDICRSCNSQRRQPAPAIRTDDSQQAQDDSRGWNRQPTPEPVAAPPSAVVEAVNRVRQNLQRRENINHETNTIQFLIMPLLDGLGWDDHDPDQVIREYKPAGKQRFRRSKAVDIALMDNGIPKVFIEAKRLDRDHIPKFDEQLAEYASHLDDGIAVLTNGRHWQFFVVSNGKPEFRHTIAIAIAIADSGAESVARELHQAIGRNVISNAGERAAPSASTQRQNRRETTATPPGWETIAENLRQYREREGKRRRQPAYTIFNNDTIELIATQRPTDLGQLGNIRGVGPSTLQQHGDAIIKIVRGEG